jgi:hypothetical protein
MPLHIVSARAVFALGASMEVLLIVERALGAPLIAERTCVVAWEWAWVQLPSVQQWRPHITADLRVDTIPIRPAIRFAKVELAFEWYADKLWTMVVMTRKSEPQ